MREERAHRGAIRKAPHWSRAADSCCRRDSYFLVFCTILATIISSAFLGDGSWGLVLTLALQTATLLLALRTSDAGPKSLRLATLVAGLAVVGVALAVLTGNYEIARIAYGASMLALIVVTPVVIVPTTDVAPRRQHQHDHRRRERLPDLWPLLGHGVCCHGRLGQNRIADRSRGLLRRVQDPGRQ